MKDFQLMKNFLITTKIYYQEANAPYIIYLMIYLANQAQYYPINQLSPTTIT